MLTDAGNEDSALIERQNILHEKCGEYYKNKAKVAFVRSRAEWMEKGEKSTKYFLGLEKCKQSNKQIKVLKNEMGERITNQNEILEEEIRLYSKLYTTSYPCEKRLWQVLERYKNAKKE